MIYHKKALHISRVVFAFRASDFLRWESLSADNDTDDTLSATEAVTEDTSHRAEYLPDVDYNGYEFRVIGCCDSYPPFLDKEIGAIICFFIQGKKGKHTLSR